MIISGCNLLKFVKFVNSSKLCPGLVLGWLTNNVYCFELSTVTTKTNCVSP